MAYGRNALEYRKNAVNSASPVGLIVLLYDGAIRFMEGGRQAILAGELERKNDQLQKSQKIVLELMSSLNMEQGGDIAKNLLALYMFVVEQLVSANVKNMTEPIDQSIQIMSNLRESWVTIEKRNRSTASALEVAVVA